MSGEVPPSSPPHSPPHFGQVVDRTAHGGGRHGKVGSFVVQDEEDERTYSFDYTDIVTEGFRTIRTGERVRFHLSSPDSWRATFVIRVDQPDPEAFYG